MDTILSLYTDAVYRVEMPNHKTAMYNTHVRVNAHVGTSYEQLPVVRRSKLFLPDSGKSITIRMSKVKKNATKRIVVLP